jgi:hypothetical protein
MATGRGMDGRIILKRILKNLGREDRVELFWAQ